MIKILVLFALGSLIDSEGWVSVERPTKSSFALEEAGTAEPQVPNWVTFGKQTGKEKVLVSFPSTPIYLYAEEGLIAASSFAEMHFQFEIRERAFQSADDLLKWRLQALQGKEIVEKNTQLNDAKEPVAELVYRSGKKWVFEWWKSTDQNTYAQISESPTKNSDFHRQFLATFDLDFDRKISS